MNNKRRVWIIRIVAILMAALMILGVGTLLFQTAFAIDGVPVTGSSAHSKLPIYLLVGAVVVVAVVAVLPKMIRKK